MENFKDIWSTSIFPTSGGNTLTVGQLVSVVLLLVLGYVFIRLAARLLHRRLSKTQMRPDVVYFVSRLVFYLLLIGIALTALSLLNIPLTAFAFVTGAVAIGVGFGAQNIINNFISGWILMTEQPIRIDDFIEIDGAYGVVERIGNRSTRIRRTDGVHMLVPNSALLEKTVVNWTLIDMSIRSTVRVGVAYGSDVKRVAELICKAVVEQKETLSKPKPVVVFDDFGDNALIFEAYFWSNVAGERELRQIRSDIRFRLTDFFNEDGIVIAFPQRDVHLDIGQPIDVRVRQSGPE